ncbi:Rossmann-like and DUF2520 domain-containing protein [Parapedobacter koreensis]|uniref:Predicted oxidoreductase, contains short-chain dehydrogenase (SDR) and DUF2520 domains n=1 Tax=Parapedobacter koreensis TaxID=332977 RepID=A0A1H7GFQ3_9SPHI|nr:Rossmann-like and DUF2520 domain-containing protein [Parapedobacter koreensis]SEK35310.1 Predicted oxidoreductase, contains short-chain dehydrogenase (SDR) and DUF2520 domains [Parapedobacter koreensis]
MDIVLLGSGNVATHLGRALVDAGYRIMQVYSPTQAHAAALAGTVNAQAIDDVTGIATNADLYIIAVKDDVLAQVVAQLPVSLKGMVVHTAGSVAMDVLAGHAGKYGVLYPVQTFSKAKAVDFSVVPIAVEASDPITYTALAGLAGNLSNRVFPCDSKQRLSLHVAAVFACNFSNHLYAIGADILREHGLDFDLIRPLILETAEKVMVHQPKDVQTGPAVRHDIGTMQKHLVLLEDEAELAELYKTLSERIGKDA